MNSGHDPPDWFDQSYSYYLNLIENNNYFKVDNNINFGKKIHNDNFCETYLFNDSSTNTNFDFVNNEITNDSQMNKKIMDKIKELSESSTNTTKEKSLLTKYTRLLEKSSKITKSRKILLDLTMSQKNIISNWFNECTIIYNTCVSEYKKNNSYFDSGFMKTKLQIFEIVKKRYNRKQLKCPYDMATDEVKKFCSNLKSCKSNLKNGHISDFNMKNKNTDNGQTVFVPKTAISKNGIYVNHLKHLKCVSEYFKKSKIKINELNDCSLTHDKKTKQYYLIICYNENTKKNNDNDNNKEEFISIDPGESTFCTYYSENGFGRIGINLRTNILKIQSKIKKFQSILDKNKDIRNKKHLINKIQKNYNKFINILEPGVHYYNLSLNENIIVVNATIVGEFQKGILICNGVFNKVFDSGIYYANTFMHEKIEIVNLITIRETYKGIKIKDGKFVEILEPGMWFANNFLKETIEEVSEIVIEEHQQGLKIIDGTRFLYKIVIYYLLFLF